MKWLLVSGSGCKEIGHYHLEPSQQEKKIWKSATFWDEIQQRIAAAAAAKSLQTCLILCNLIDGSPPGSYIPGILQARILEWVAISFSNRELKSQEKLLPQKLERQIQRITAYKIRSSGAESSVGTFTGVGKMKP